ncbi:MAG: hypothetical protein Harvfovirus66_6 [Harvfovirus sp.]|uniref:Uncharacterized protein n=1 Tax=Harvfovirus sp. TaxID=2487768 RepID=A0A3G5A3L8_9VIRU|nr:MAG: hypothetical protein Harvfovirus66_6 [Harvfovirus sp.]
MTTFNSVTFAKEMIQQLEEMKQIRLALNNDLKLLSDPQYLQKRKANMRTVMNTLSLLDKRSAHEQIEITNKIRKKFANDHILSVEMVLIDAHHDISVDNQRKQNKKTKRMKYNKAIRSPTLVRIVKVQF